MQALVAYAERDTNRGLYNMQVDIRPSASGGFQQQVRLEKGRFAENTDIKVSPTRCANHANNNV